jgi:predicted metal-dependent HD superfamily phosphohydrolase
MNGHFTQVNITNSLKTTFISIIKNYNQNIAKGASLWTDIVTHYNSAQRHYHNLIHLNTLLHELTLLKPIIVDWNTIFFSLFYHDIIYDVQSKTNEEDSADYAAEVMSSLKIQDAMIEKCRLQILATKQHQSNGDHDTDLFTDADLSILGSEPETYKLYASQIRKEYAIYPDELYNPGRKNVLNHFLQMKRIYKTDHFFDKYVEKAKVNLLNEMDLL